MVVPDPSKYFSKFGKFPPDFKIFFVFSSYMKKSFLYPLLLSTSAFVMVVLDGTWLSWTQAKMSPSLEYFHPIWQFHGLLQQHEEVLLVPPPTVHLCLGDCCLLWDMFVPDPSKHFTKFGKCPPNFNNFMVFSSYMKRSFLYPLLLSTLAFVMVVLVGTWLFSASTDSMQNYMKFGQYLTTPNVLQCVNTERARAHICQRELVS